MSQTNELRAMLADVVTRIFTDLVTKDVLEAAEHGTGPDALWRAIEENGLTLQLVPEAQGGAGGSWADALVVMSAAGRHAAPVPLVETMVGAWLLSRAGLEVPPGPITIAPGSSADRLRLVRGAGSWRLDGAATRVPWGRVADHVVVVLPGDGRTMVALVAGDACEITPDENLAREPRDTLAFRGPVAAAAPAEGISGDAVRVYGALARSAQMAGSLESVLAQATQYATERKQFGRAIGSFQAIQQQLAVLAGHAAASTMAAAAAFRAADRGEPRFEVAVAKTRIGEAAGVAAGIAHQVHGAIGFTYEHSLHFATRRLWSWRTEFGGESDWATTLGRDVIARGADALWPFVTAR